MRILIWVFRALIFFTLFAFALNNQQQANVRWFFGIEWHAPMVIVVLVVFAAGCALGYLSFRFPAIPWREPHANLARLADKLATRPSFIDTLPPSA